MSYPDPQTVVAFSAADHKHAALFFDRIVPLHSAVAVPSEVTWPFWEKARFEADTDWWQSSIRPLWDAELDDYEELPKRFRAFLESWETDLTSLPFTLDDLANLPLWGGRMKGENLSKQEVIETVMSALVWNEMQHVLGHTRNQLAVMLATTMVEGQLHFVPVLGESEHIGTNLPEGDDTSVSVVLANLRLVNTEKAEWEQILELRHDDEARRQLRNLRLFLAENFSGKSAAYVRDAMEKKIDDYEAACRKHGFDFMLTSMKSLFDSKSALGFGAIVAAAIVTGQKEVASVAGGVGAVFESSRFVLSLLQAKHDLSRFKREHELAYVFRARESLQTLPNKRKDA